MSPRLLVSVVNADEARLATELGVPLLDIKDPQRGSLGMANLQTLQQCLQSAREVSSAVQLSVACGEVADWVASPPFTSKVTEQTAHRSPVPSLRVEKRFRMRDEPEGLGGPLDSPRTSASSFPFQLTVSPRFLKLGLAGVLRSTQRPQQVQTVEVRSSEAERSPLLMQWQADWSTARSLVEQNLGLSGCAQAECEKSHNSSGSADLNRSQTDWVAVCYVDAQRAEAPPIEAVLAAATRAGLAGLLFDTCLKDEKRLFDFVDQTTLQKWIAAIHAAGLFVAVAGRLTQSDIERLLELPIDIIGVRSAACADHQRTGKLSPERVDSLLRLFQV